MEIDTGESVWAKYEDKWKDATRGQKLRTLAADREKYASALQATKHLRDTHEQPKDSVEGGDKKTEVEGQLSAMKTRVSRLRSY